NLALCRIMLSYAVTAEKKPIKTMAPVTRLRSSAARRCSGLHRLAWDGAQDQACTRTGLIAPQRAARKLGRSVMKRLVATSLLLSGLVTASFVFAPLALAQEAP